MCDTMVATPSATLHQEMIFAKNSDREPNEAQVVTFVPAQDHDVSEKVKCAYIEIPQVEKTNAVLLCRPFWMYGAEMGVNEHGVAIGNEAVFTKEKYNKKGLTGMDILRLALERSSTAKNAFDIIIQLLEEYGQGGVCGYEEDLLYHNAFIIADCDDAFIIETAGAHWAARKVEDVAGISNALSIKNDYTITSKGLEDYAVEKGYSKKGKSLDFMEDFSDFIYTYFGKGRQRQAISSALLQSKKGSITSRDMMGFLRNHNTPESLQHPFCQPFIAGKKPMERLCLHAGGLISAQTTGSMVVLLKKDCPPLVYLTGTSAPCLSLFKPHIVSGSIEKNQLSILNQDNSIDLYGSPNGSYSDDNLWWAGEDVHRRMIMNYPALAPKWQEQINKAEERMTAEIEEGWQKGADNIAAKCAEFAASHVEEAMGFSKTLSADFSIKDATAPFLFRRHWQKINKKAKFNY